MDISLIIAIGTSIIGALAWAIRALLARIDEMERQVALKTTEQEVRQIVSDKVEPIKESMKEVKLAIDKVYDLLIDAKK